MRYNHYSIKARKAEKLTGGSPWAYKEGVFLSPNGKYIARVRDGKCFKTLSQHDTREAAQKVYDEFHLK